MDVGGIQKGWRFSLILDGPLVLMSVPRRKQSRITLGDKFVFRRRTEGSGTDANPLSYQEECSAPIAPPCPAGKWRLVE